VEEYLSSKKQRKKMKQDQLGLCEADVSIIFGPLGRGTSPIIVSPYPFRIFPLASDDESDRWFFNFFSLCGYIGISIRGSQATSANVLIFLLLADINGFVLHQVIIGNKELNMLSKLGTK
jgi:hypothetical protein